MIKIAENKSELRADFVYIQKKIDALFNPPFNASNFKFIKRDYLIKASVCSTFFYQFCLKYPEELLLQLENPKSTQQLLKDLNVSSQSLRYIRQLKCAELVYNISENILPYPLQAKFLTDLAKKLLSIAYDYSFNQSIQNQFPDLKSKLQIIILGKLGADELNFSSDIDLLFICEDNLLDSEYRAIKRWAQNLTQLLSEVTSDGFVYRVDLRLRPFGTEGPIVSKYSALKNYLFKNAKTWERFAFMRAQILNLDLDVNFSHKIKKLIEDFIYRPYFDYDVNIAIRALKNNIRSESKKKGRESNLKLGIGGIREIEFIVQSILLSHGDQIKFRTHHMLTAFDLLLSEDHLDYDPEEIENLKSAYILLRRAENALQILKDQQTHEIPNNIKLQAQWALLLNYTTIEDCLEAISSARAQVVHVFEKILAPEMERSSDLNRSQDTFQNQNQNNNNPIQTTLNTISQKIIQRYNFSESYLDYFNQSIFKYLSLKLNHSTQKYSDYSEYANLISLWLNKLLGRPTYLQRVIEHPKIAIKILELIGESEWLKQILIQHPFLQINISKLGEIKPPLEYQNLQWALSSQFQGVDLNSISNDESIQERVFEYLRQFKLNMMFRIAVADLSGKLALMRVSDHLTYLAEVILQFTWNIAWKWIAQKYKDQIPIPPIQSGLIVAYGKLGGIELSYLSDLDLVFLYPTQSNQSNQSKQSNQPDSSYQQFYTLLARKILSLLTLKSYSGAVYEIDLRLRPSGQSGMLVSDFKSFETYQINKAWTWEHQALLRSRAVAGSEQSIEYFEKLRINILQKLAEPYKLISNQLTLQNNIKNMRLKMQAELKFNKQNFADQIKYNRGGLIDVEFISQYLGLRYALDCPETIIYSDVIRILEASFKSNLISKNQLDILWDAYKLYRFYLHRLTIQPHRSLDKKKILEIQSQIQLIWDELLD